MSHEIFFPVVLTLANKFTMKCINKESNLETLTEINVCKPHCSYGITRVAGQVVAYFFYSLEKRRIKIERIVVHPNHRRQGIATDIVNAIAERYTPCTVQITLDASNIEANDWARAVGFGRAKFIRGCESSGDKVQLEFMETGSV